jgi:hypothetical protein
MNYVARIGERLYVVQPDRSIYPDVAVLERLSLRPVQQVSSTTAVLEDSPIILTVVPEEIRESFIQVLALKPQKRVVTIIEILSHANKAANSPGRQLYLDKQREVLESEAHLVEIDLLRAGQHTLAIPKDRLMAEVGTWDYLICLHRSTRRWDYECWPRTVRTRLPHLRVPLTGDDPDILVDLQVMFDGRYDAGRYAGEIDYCTEPVPPLNAEATAWADALLREKGLRN